MSKLKDLTGETFGYLTVLNRAENDKHNQACWLCKCKCGNELVVNGHDLRTEHTKSCGCSRNEFAFDLTGKIVGYLTVIKRVENNNARHARWLCKCKCGEETIVTASRLQREITKSCGCLQKEIISAINKKEEGESSRNRVYSVYKYNAKKDKKEFSLSNDEVNDIISQDCYYCNKPPSQVMKNRYSNGDTIYTGIDRIDNTKGYVQGNVRPCCDICNYAKGELTEKEFFIKMKMIFEHLHLEN